jgi:hypothetical protein
MSEYAPDKWVIIQMNERLLELAKQAGLKKDHGSDREYIGDFDWREFADLIVRECIGAVDIPTHLNGEAEHYFREAAQLIRNHFGVEE